MRGARARPVPRGPGGRREPGARARIDARMAASGEPQEIRERLKEVYHDLPEAMRRIADALMSDPLLGALWGIESASS